MNSIYSNLIKNPPEIHIPKGTTKVILNMVSCMCDNRSQIIITRENKEVSISASLRSGMGYSFSSYQTGFSVEDIKWEIDDENWYTVIAMIKNGTAQIESFKCK